MALLAGRRAVVTGAAQGIGFEIARVLGQAGGRLVVGDIDEAAGADAVRRLAAMGVEATFRRCDVTAEADVAGLIAHCAERFGPVDVMVNNAGITRDATMRTMSMRYWAI